MYSKCEHPTWADDEYSKIVSCFVEENFFAHDMSHPLRADYWTSRCFRANVLLETNVYLQRVRDINKKKNKFILLKKPVLKRS